MTTTVSPRPRIVSTDEWKTAQEAVLAQEKEATRMLDRVAAARRRLPMRRLDGAYTLEGPEGSARLLDLFEGRRQLVVYHFMFDPGWEEGCVGCSFLADSFGHLAHLNARDTSFAMVSRAPLAKLQAYGERMGWSLPWYSSHGTDFNDDLGATVDGHETPLMSVFFRDGDEIFLTHQTTGRGLDHMNFVFRILDLTPLGRQESWEDSPEGWPQSAPYEWWRRHDEYKG